MIRPDAIDPLIGIPLVIVLLIVWFVIEVRRAKPDPHPDELSSLDVLEKTGHYPG